MRVAEWAIYQDIKFRYEVLIDLLNKYKLDEDEEVVIGEIYNLFTKLDQEISSNLRKYPKNML